MVELARESEVVHHDFAVGLLFVIRWEGVLNLSVTSLFVRPLFQKSATYVVSNH